MIFFLEEAIALIKEFDFNPTSEEKSVISAILYAILSNLDDKRIIACLRVTIGISDALNEVMRYSRSLSYYIKIIGMNDEKKIWNKEFGDKEMKSETFQNKMKEIDALDKSLGIKY